MTSQILRKVPVKLHWTCPTEGPHQLPQVPLSSQTHQISVVRQDYWPSPTWNTLPFSLISFLYLQRLRIQTGHQEVGKNHLRAQYTNTARIWKVSHSVTAGCVFPKYSRNTSVTDELSPTSQSQYRSHDQCRITVWHLYLSMGHPPTSWVANGMPSNQTNKKAGILDMFFQSAFKIIMCCKPLSTFIFKANLKLDFSENLTLYLDCFMFSASCFSRIIHNSQRTPGFKLRITK